MSAYLEIRSVTKSFGRAIALHAIDLEVQRGEMLCVLGPSGCGKTTLLRILAGLEMQDSGTILQEGRDVSRLQPAQRDFGIVFQSYALFPNLTASQNVAYGLRSLRRPRAEVDARVRALLERVGLAGAGGRFPAQLSGGQQQRVALARALALEPGLLLLDEPLSALDPPIRAALRSEIKSLQRQLGVTTILVTHDQEEALSMADRIAILREGHVVQVGTPIEVYRRPASAFVARFVGLMNFLPDGTAIRPEDVEMLGPDPEGATVEEAVFLGSYWRLRLRLHSGATCLAHVPGPALGALPLESGIKLGVRLPPERLLRYG